MYIYNHHLSQVNVSRNLTKVWPDFVTITEKHIYCKANQSEVRHYVGKMKQASSILEAASQKFAIICHVTENLNQMFIKMNIQLFQCAHG